MTWPQGQQTIPPPTTSHPMPNQPDHLTPRPSSPLPPCHIPWTTTPRPALDTTTPFSRCHQSASHGHWRKSPKILNQCSLHPTSNLPQRLLHATVCIYIYIFKKIVINLSPNFSDKFDHHHLLLIFCDYPLSFCH